MIELQAFVATSLRPGSIYLPFHELMGKIPRHIHMVHLVDSSLGRTPSPYNVSGTHEARMRGCGHHGGGRWRNGGGVGGWRFGGAGNAREGGMTERAR